MTRDNYISPEEKKAAFAQLNSDYRNGTITHKKYVAQHSRIRLINSLTNRMKRVGVKVTRGGCGYLFHGKHFTVEFGETGCETTQWWVDETSVLNCDKAEAMFAWSAEETRQDDPCQTKHDIVGWLFDLDNRLEAGVTE